MGPIGRPETPVRNSQFRVRNRFQIAQFSSASWRKPGISQLSFLDFHFRGVVAQFGDVTDTLIREPGFDSRQKEELKNAGASNRT